MLDLELYKLHYKLLCIFDVVMCEYINHPSITYTNKIHNGELSIDDIELGLQNKCINETYLYDPLIKDKLIVIGGDIYGTSKNADDIIERLFQFNSQLNSKEILLLAQIRSTLPMYNGLGIRRLQESAKSMINGREYAPLNPSLSSISKNISDLYELYKKLQYIVYKGNYLDKNTSRTISLEKINSYYYLKKYKQCKKEILRHNRLYGTNICHEFIDLLCEYMLNHKSIAYDKLDAIIAKKLIKSKDVLSYRNNFKDIIHDKIVVDILNKYYEPEKITELNDLISKEDRIQGDFIKQANELKNYYITKMNH